MIIAVCNQKGGVGKTTTAVNLSAGLALQHRKKVLLVDFDPQANATSGLGVNKDGVELSVYNFLHAEAGAEAVLKTGIDNLHILASSISLCGAEIELIEGSEREFRFKSRIQEIVAEYDVVIVDTPPSLGILTINALVASDRVIVPIQCEYYALEGLVDFLNTLNLIKERLNTELDILGILLTMADYRTKIAHDVETEIRQKFQQKVFHTVIHRNVRLAEAPSHGLPIEIYDASSVGAYGYRKLVDEVASILGDIYGEEKGVGQRPVSADS